MKQCINSSGVLVCVTDQYSCENLIKRGKSIADEHKLPLSVLNVSPQNSGCNVNSDALQHLYNVSKQYGAPMSVIYNDDVSLITAGFICKNNITAIVTGMPKVEGMGFVYELHTLLPDLKIYMLSSEDNVLRKLNPPKNKNRLAFNS